MMDSDLEDELFAMVNNDHEIRRVPGPARHQKPAPPSQPAVAGETRFTEWAKNQTFAILFHPSG